jgi:hypothetical protein
MDVGRQAAAAAEWLVGQATTHGSVLAVTHGAIRRYIAAELIVRGWRGPDRRPLAPWSAWTLQRGR